MVISSEHKCTSSASLYSPYRFITCQSLCTCGQTSVWWHMRSGIASVMRSDNKTQMFHYFKLIRYHILEVIVSKFFAIILYLSEVNPILDSLDSKLLLQLSWIVWESLLKILNQSFTGFKRLVRHSIVEMLETIQNLVNNVSSTTNSWLHSKWEAKTPAAPSPDWSSLQRYTLAEVAEHCHYNDCWLIVYDRVYDATNFLNEVNIN